MRETRLHDVNRTRLALTRVTLHAADVLATVEHTLAFDTTHGPLHRVALDLKLGLATVALARHYRLTGRARTRVTELHTRVLALELTCFSAAGLADLLIVEPEFVREREGLGTNVAAGVGQRLLEVFLGKRRTVLGFAPIRVDFLAAEADILVGHGVELGLAARATPMSGCFVCVDSIGGGYGLVGPLFYATQVEYVKADVTMPDGLVAFDRLVADHALAFVLFQLID